MQIERLNVEALMPYARNSRTHSDAQIAVVIDVAIRRWQQFTGLCAVRESDGAVFHAEKVGAGETVH